MADFFSNLFANSGQSSSRRSIARRRASNVNPITGASPRACSRGSLTGFGGFRDPFASNARPRNNGSHDRDPSPSSTSRYPSSSFGDLSTCPPLRSSHSRRGSNYANDYSQTPSTTTYNFSRRAAVDVSSEAFDRYDPFNGGLRRGSDFLRTSDGDPSLPPYRSASAYARDPGGFPPDYGRPRHDSRVPPVYSSFSNSQRDGLLRTPPIQYPPTRRPSGYGGRGPERGFGYEVSKWEDRY